MDSNKYIKYQAYQTTDNVRGGGLFSPEQCKQLAEKLMKMYDENQDGQLDLLDVSQMHQDCYRAMNKSYNPTPTDIAAFTRKMDNNGKGRIDKSMLEQICLKYLSSNVSNNNLNSQITQIIEEPKIQLFSSPPPQQIEIQLQSSNIPDDSQFKPTISIEKVQSPIQKIETVQSPPPKVEEVKKIQSPPIKIEEIKKIASPQIKKDPVPSPKPIVQPKPEQKIEPPKVEQKPVEKHYSRQVEDRLKVARRIFTIIDFDKSGYITEQEVPQLLIETYKQMGMTLEPTQEDVDLWMEMADLDKDGKVYLRDYEDLILKSLKTQGIQLE